MMSLRLPGRTGGRPAAMPTFVEADQPGKRLPLAGCAESAPLNQGVTP